MTTAMFRGGSAQLLFRLPAPLAHNENNHGLPPLRSPVFHERQIQLVLGWRRFRLRRGCAVVRPVDPEIRVHEHRGGRPRGRVSLS